MTPSPNPSPRITALVVAYGLPPYAGIGAQRTLRLLTHLARDARWDVRVLTASPDAYAPDTPVDPKLLDRMPPGVPVVRTTVFRGLARLGRAASVLKRRLRPPTPPGSTPVPEAMTAAAGTAARRRPGLKRTLEELAAMPDKNVGWILPASVRALRTWSSDVPDVIYSSGPPWSGHLVAGLLARRWGRPWVADFRDPWVRSPWTRYKSAPAHRVGAWLERRVVESASFVTFTTQTARDEFAAEYGPALAEKFRTVANGCDRGEFDGLPAFDEAPNAPFVVLHAGSLYGGRSPSPVLRAAARVVADIPEAGTRLRLRFLGDGLDPAGLELCRSLGIERLVELGGRVSRRESLAEMKRAGALLILQAGLTLAIPGKLYEYFAAGRPVLALCEPGEMADVITQHRLGFVVSPQDEVAIATALERLLRADPWLSPATPALYDGQLRAGEAAALMEEAVAAHPVDAVAVRHVSENVTRSTTDGGVRP